MINIKSIVPFFIVVIIATSCNTKPEYPIVASWNDINLATDVFKKQYINYASTAPVKDEYQVRKNYASYLLEQQIISEIAKQDGSIRS